MTRSLLGQVSEAYLEHAAATMNALASIMVPSSSLPGGLPPPLVQPAAGSAGPTALPPVALPPLGLPPSPRAPVRSPITPLAAAPLVPLSPQRSPAPSPWQSAAEEATLPAEAKALAEAGRFADVRDQCGETVAPCALAWAWSKAGGSLPVSAAALMLAAEGQFEELGERFGPKAADVMHAWVDFKSEGWAAERDKRAALLGSKEQRTVEHLKSSVLAPEAAGRLAVSATHDLFLGEGVRDPGLELPELAAAHAALAAEEVPILPPPPP